MNRKILGFIISTLLIVTIVLPVTGKLNISKTKDIVENISIILDEYPLPTPISVDMILEESICRRMSVRSFNGESVTDEELSTILWAAIFLLYYKLYELYGQSSVHWGLEQSGNPYIRYDDQPF